MLSLLQKMVVININDDGGEGDDNDDGEGDDDDEGNEWIRGKQQKAPT